MRKIILIAFLVTGCSAQFKAEPKQAQDKLPFAATGDVQQLPGRYQVSTAQSNFGTKAVLLDTWTGRCWMPKDAGLLPNSGNSSGGNSSDWAEVMKQLQH